MFSFVPHVRQAKVDYQYFMFERVSEFHPVTSEDVKAFQWVQQNISKRRRFFVSPHGSGRWIPMYTKHIALPPSALRLTSPQEKRFDRLVSMLRKGTITARTLELLSEFQISYVYVGVKHYPWNPDTFKSASLRKSDYFDRVFKSGEVEIFQVLYTS